MICHCQMLLKCCKAKLLKMLFIKINSFLQHSRYYALKCLHSRFHSVYSVKPLRRGKVNLASSHQIIALLSVRHVHPACVRSSELLPWSDMAPGLYLFPHPCTTCLPPHTRRSRTRQRLSSAHTLLNLLFWYLASVQKLN